MEPVDQQTAAFYEEFGASAAERWETIPADAGVAQVFDDAFDAASTILDIGCGSGRDMSDLLRRGHDVYGIEPSSELRRHAERLHPELAERITPGSLPDAVHLPPPWPKLFDAIVCSAVLMHLPVGLVSDAFGRVRCMLRSRGRMLLSIPSARPVVVDQRDPNGRLFSGITADQVVAAAEVNGFRLHSIWSDLQDAQGRVGNSWDVLLLETDN